MSGQCLNWATCAALALCGGTAGIVYAQDAEPAVEPEAASEDAVASAEGPLFPDLLPGYYRQTVTVRNVEIDMPAKWGRDLGRNLRMPPMTEQFCYSGADLQRASEFLPGIGDLEQCRVTAATLEGTHGEGQIVCGNAQFRMVMRYAGEFTDTSATLTINAEMRSKSREGAMTFKFDLAMERIAETCSEELEETPEDAAEAAASAAGARAAAEAAKKM